MQGSTPCTEWNVQAWILHNIKVAGFAAGVLEENITVNPTDVEGAIPGGDPVKALDDSVAKVLETIRASGSVDKQTSTPFGDMTRGQFLVNPAWHLLMHNWDLAKGTGQDATTDSGLVQLAHNTVYPQADAMWEMDFGGGHIIGPRIQVPADASRQDQLLGAFGRQP